jgi:RNA polymerase sigma factor (TIGR02999 family)
MTDVTKAISEIEHGDPAAAERLLPLVYEELRKLAAAKLAHEQPGQTLQATALVHEAYLRMIGPADAEPQQWRSRGYFFAAAAESMRRILVEKARSKGRIKHGGERKRVDLDAACTIAEPAPALDLLALDEALTKLANAEPAKAELVKLRFFAGLTMPQAAAAMDISLATAERYWTFARSWLYAELADRPARSS